MKTELRFGTMKWIHYASPSKQEIEELVDTHEFHELIVEDLDDVNVQSKIDQYDTDIFVVLTFPKYNVQTKRYIINEFNAILGKDYIITVSTYDSNHIAKIIEGYKQDLAESDVKDEEAYKISPYYILYTIIDEMYTKMLKAQANSMKDVLAFERSLTTNDFKRVQIQDFMRMKSNTVFMKYAFLPQRPILSEIQKACVGFYEGDLDVYFEDLESKLEKIINNTMISYETIQSLTDTYDAGINNQMNEIMRVLTFLTAIFAMLNLITSFYGMNIQLPFMQHPAAWRAIIIIMVLFIAIMMFIFKRKKWM